MPQHYAILIGLWTCLLVVVLAYQPAPEQPVNTLFVHPAGSVEPPRTWDADTVQFVSEGTGLVTVTKLDPNALSVPHGAGFHYLTDPNDSLVVCTPHTCVLLERGQ